MTLAKRNWWRVGFGDRVKVGQAATDGEIWVSVKKADLT